MDNLANVLMRRASCDRVGAMDDMSIPSGLTKRALTERLLMAFLRSRYCPACLIPSRRLQRVEGKCF